MRIQILQQLYCKWENMVLVGRDKAQRSTMTTLNYYKWFSLPRQAQRVIKKILQRHNFKLVMPQLLMELVEVDRQLMTHKNMLRISTGN
jgi:hypothetical protein